MKKLLFDYVGAFNCADEERFSNDIDNASAAEWMYENIPLVRFPEKELERIYYFRWWVFRKHIKSTPYGRVITEFLPPVPWAGAYNTISAPLCHHVAEGKWLKCGRSLCEEYLAFWLSEKGKTLTYSTPISDSVFRLCTHFDDPSFAVDHLDEMVGLYEKTEAEQLTESGLFWSYDCNDGMEFSISGGTTADGMNKGLRPTINCYMAANARAVANTAVWAGRKELAEVYREKYETLKKCINSQLWIDGFYRSVYSGGEQVRELVGYLPWLFGLAPDGREDVFALLKDERGFSAPFGLTTAERSHPRYLFEYDHECLWNGYVWPFATTQTLGAVLKVLGKGVLNNDDFYEMLLTYAKMHQKDGVCWIDEVMHPETGEWSSRKVLEEWGWPEAKGGRERGRDYNHSSFCDLVLSGLLGIVPENGRLTVTPRVPKSWKTFEVDRLWYQGRCYQIRYDNGKVRIKERYDE